MNPRTLCKLEGSRDGNGIDTDRLDVRHTLQSRVRILETVTGHRAHDGQARLEPALCTCGEQAGDTGCRRRFDEDALGGGDQTVSLADLLVGGGTECTVRLFLRGDRAVPGRGRTESACGGGGFWGSAERRVGKGGGREC